MIIGNAMNTNRTFPLSTKVLRYSDVCVCHPRSKVGCLASKTHFSLRTGVSVINLDL